MLPHQVNQALFAEFSEIIFWFGHAVAISQEEFPWTQRDRCLLITSAVEQADDRAPLLQSSHRPILAQDNGGQVTAVAVGELALAAVVHSEKQSCVFLRRGALVKLMIEQGKHGAG